MSYRWASATDVGRHRAGNEDAIHPTQGAGSGQPVVAIVADGMGGAVGGEIASRVAVEAAAAAEGDVTERVRAANSAVVEAVADNPGLAGMGTTITMALFGPDGTVQIGHVGDSRAYLIRDGRLEQVTDDHSLVAELVAAGRIRPEEVATHPQRHLVTRVLGMAPQIPVDTVELELEPGDRVLFCSDGLTGMLADEHIEDILGEAGGLEEGLAALVAAVNEAGGVDNISMVIVERE